jgi:hypothetical protein
MKKLIIATAMLAISGVSFDAAAFTFNTCLPGTTSAEYDEATGECACSCTNGLTHRTVSWDFNTSNPGNCNNSECWDNID